MGCEGGEVTSDNIKMLELLEDFLSYPPRFRLQFNVQDDVIDARSQNVKVRFNQAKSGRKHKGNIFK